MDLRACTGDVIDAGLFVHRDLGPGLLESAYHKCLVLELRERGHVVREKVILPITFKGHRITPGFQADIIVDDAVLVEVKAVERLHRIHEAQILTYLKLSGITVGLILNFHEPLFKDGIVRFINTYR